MSAKKLPNEEELIEEPISMEHPIKPHHEPEPEESDYEHSPEAVFGEGTDWYCFSDADSGL